MQPLLSLPDRQIFFLAGEPSAFFIRDKQAGGILLNTPPYSAELHQQLGRIDFIFLPSHRGAAHLQAWREQDQPQVLAHEYEAALIPQPVDVRINRQYKLSRTIDFVLMAGVTSGTCALLLKNNPGVLFFGPALQHGEDGWPQLLPNADDQSWENRLMGSLGLQDLKFNYAFCDNFSDEQHHYGPEADKHIQQQLQKWLGRD